MAAKTKQPAKSAAEKKLKRSSSDVQLILNAQTAELFLHFLEGSAVRHSDNELVVRDVVRTVTHELAQQLYHRPE